MDNNFKRVKYACYMSNMCMSIVSMLSPILFITLRGLYGLSYTMLGLLVLINFCTQLIVDIIFSLFSHKFNIDKTVKSIPVIISIGFVIYAVLPVLFPQFAFLGLVIGTVVFSSACGLAEVLTSPVIAALPSDNTERDLSNLHSVFAWGVVAMAIFSTIYFLIFGTENWFFLVIALLIVPFSAMFLFKGTTLPKMETPKKTSGAFKIFSNKKMLFCMFCIFLGGASETIMSQWSAGYIEQSLGLSKFWSDIIGIAMFAVAMGIARTLYAHIGKNIYRVMFLGAIGATLCYSLAIFANIPFINAAACALTGFCVAMMWPGSLIIANDRFPTGGVAVFALMAAGGDLGASMGPQLVGIISDIALQNDGVISIAENMGITTEQIAIKSGLLIAMVFPVTAIFVYGYLFKTMGSKGTKVKNSH